MKNMIIAAALLFSACGSPNVVPSDKGPGVTLSQFTEIKDGMTYAEVSALLGSPGVEQSSNNIAGMKTIMYAWDGKSGLGNMNAMFQNDKLIQKSQFGLE